MATHWQEVPLEGEPDLKRRRLEKLSDKFSSDEMRTIEWFINSFWPKPENVPRDFNQSQADYDALTIRSGLVFRSWQSWLMEVLFLKDPKWINIPYFKDNLPPEGMREARKVDRSSVPFPVGTGLIVFFFTQSLYGPRGWSKKAIIPKPNDVVWTEKWLNTDFHAWIKDKRFFSDMESIQKSMFVQELASTRKNELNLGAKDTSLPSSVYVPPEVQKSKDAKIGYRPQTTWGIDGTQKKNYPANWPNWQEVHIPSKGLFPDWPEPLGLSNPISNKLLPSLVPLSTKLYPSVRIRKGFFDLLNPDTWNPVGFSFIHQEMLEWMAPGNEACFHYLGLISQESDKRLDPPLQWRTLVTFSVFHQYAMLMHINAPFLCYVTALNYSDDESILSSLQAKMIEFDATFDVTYPIFSSHTENFRSTPLIQLIAGSQSLTKYIGLIQKTSTELDAHDIRILSESAFKPFQILWGTLVDGVDISKTGLVKPVQLEVRWKIKELLEFLNLNEQSSSKYLREVLHFVTFAMLKKIGTADPETIGHEGSESGEQKIDTIITPVVPRGSSAFSSWLPGYGKSPALAFSKIQELYLLWSKDGGNWFTRLFTSGEAFSTHWSIVGETDPIYAFIQSNMIPPLKNKGIFGTGREILATMFDSESTDFEKLVQLQFESYILWCELNSKAQSKINYPPVGSQMKDEKGQLMFNSLHKEVRNLMPDMGIIQSEGNKTPTMLKFLGAWWSFFGDDFYRFIKSVFEETFSLIIKVLRFVLQAVTDIVKDYWPALLGVVGVIVGGVLLTKVVEKKL